MNREECLKALEKIKNDQYFIAEDDEGDLIHIVNLYKNELKTLRCLIEEHFDNPPLKFEELKVGMWVWDSKFKVYNEIYTLLKNFMSTKHNLVQFKHLNETTQWGDTIEFEENRFYRKRVEE